jgi:hypothetical protein
MTWQRDGSGSKVKEGGEREDVYKGNVKPEDGKQRTQL